ncbi:hypothetical protein KL930_000157 [Ogataea haglerorum]|uniref:Aldehyde dehydrogenase n=1 Tax=Ogataea haglerorum TaxID=1937702 RepID=A0AAN6I140_9ASCO|nr:hypothetical protein KL951_002362 [Ogataea haglerorum]KAG7701390.1 hypothetical protein KL915_000421 [Ogataea haglerorum]KAG7706609.1 hypothetical protein KL950_003274 [Ogataea haglerorum]KAG7709348.1 hypothetical protein KL914_001738 [Ogataea haglerorum]KAG7717789.1 hypothetical protein KL913_002725 [Ogataea haglerorum]
MSLVALGEIPDAVNKLRLDFVARPRKSHAFIKAQLLSLKDALQKHQDSIVSALLHDFHRSSQETLVTEFGPLLSEISYLAGNLSSLLAPETPDAMPIAFSVASCKIEKEPLGTVLVISPFNFPLSLSLSPVAGAIAAGNNVVLKLPGDKCPEFCKVLSRVLAEALDPEILVVVTGGLKEAQAVLEQKYDKIVFTGSTAVGKIVHAKAAESLTPTLLELGGKSPAFITAGCPNIRTALARLFWGKFCNAGQVCVAPDYLLVQDSVYDQVVAEMVAVLQKTYQVSEASDYTHLVDSNSFNRLAGLLEKTRGKLLFGGARDRETNFVAPTVVTDVDWDDPLMQSEIFGPILPVLRYSSLAEAVQTVQQHHDTPLATYIFSDKQEEVQLVDSIRSGALSVNDTVVHAGIHTCPFGGVGTSGMGNYHGRYSIESFTHRKVVLKQPYWYEVALKDRYAPYSAAKSNWLMFVYRLPSIRRVRQSDLVTVLAVVLAGLVGYFIGKR